MRSNCFRRPCLFVGRPCFCADQRAAELPDLDRPGAGFGSQSTSNYRGIFRHDRHCRCLPGNSGNNERCCYCRRECGDGSRWYGRRWHWNASYCCRHRHCDDRRAAPSVNLNVINGGNTYNTVAASQSTQALTGGGGGATGDYLSHCTVIPTTVSPGVVTIIDNATTIYAFPGGASSLSNLVPFTIPIGAKSTSGAWKVTTGTGLSVVCVGKFT